MYQRYTPNVSKHHTVPPQNGFKAPHNPHSMPKPTLQKECATQSVSSKSRNNKNPVSSFIPPSLYNPETQKVLGLFSAEDILLAALIFLLLEKIKVLKGLMVC